MLRFKFTKEILSVELIDTRSFDDLKRDFAHVSALVEAIRLLTAAEACEGQPDRRMGQSVAPFRAINIGDLENVHLIDFMVTIEAVAGIKGERNLPKIQPEDVPASRGKTALPVSLAPPRF